MNLTELSDASLLDNNRLVVLQQSTCSTPANHLQSLTIHATAATEPCNDTHPANSQTIRL